MAQEPELSQQADQKLRSFLMGRARELVVTNPRESLAIANIEARIRSLPVEDRQRLTNMLNQNPDAAIARLKQQMDQNPQLAQQVSSNPKILMTTMGLEQQRPAVVTAPSSIASPITSPSALNPGAVPGRSALNPDAVPGRSALNPGAVPGRSALNPDAVPGRSALTSGAPPAAATPPAPAANAPAGASPVAAAAATAMQSFDRALDDKQSGIGAFLKNVSENAELRAGLAALTGGDPGKADMALSDKQKEALGALYAQDKNVFNKLNELSKNPEFAKLVQKIGQNKDLQESMGMGGLDSPEGARSLAQTIDRLHRHDKQDKEFLAYANRKMDTAGNSGIGQTMLRFMAASSGASGGAAAVDALAGMKRMEGMFDGLKNSGIANFEIGGHRLGDVLSKFMGFLEKMPIIGPLISSLKGALGMGNTPVAVQSNNGGRLTQDVGAAMAAAGSSTTPPSVQTRPDMGPAMAAAGDSGERPSVQIAAQYDADGQRQQPGAKPGQQGPGVTLEQAAEQQRIAQRQASVQVS